MAEIVASQTERVDSFPSTKPGDTSTGQQTETVATHAQHGDSFRPTKPGDIFAGRQQGRREALEHPRQATDTLGKFGNVADQPPPAYGLLTTAQYADLLESIKRHSVYGNFSSQASTAGAAASNQQEPTFIASHATSYDEIGPMHIDSEREDPLEAQLEEVAPPAEGTCRWVFDRLEYKVWRESEELPAVSVIRASPGLGKSVLVKSICLQLRDELGPDSVFAFFCKSGISDRSTTLSIVATFLYGLMKDRGGLRFLCESHTSFKHLDRKALQRLLRADTAISFERMWAIFAEMASQDFAMDYVFIIDALDECSFDSQLDLERVLRASNTTFKGRVLITGRSERVLPILAESFPETSIHISASSLLEDAKTFVRRGLEHRGHSKLVSPRLIQKINETILDNVDGFFLLLSCRLNELATRMLQPGFQTDSEYLEKLFNQPFVPVFDYFAQMLEKMVLSGAADSGVSILNLVLAAQEPLTEEKLAAAACFSKYDIDSEDQYWNKMPMNMFYEAKMLCGSILQLSGDIKDPSTTIDLVHDKAREFLEGHVLEYFPRLNFISLLGINSQQGQVMMAIACLRCLLFPGPLHEDRSVPMELPFHWYAIWNWPIHVKQSAQRISEYLPLLASFIADPMHGYERCAEIWSAAKAKIRNRPNLPDPISLTIVDYELANVLYQLKDKSLQGCGIDLDATDFYGRTALYEAIQQEKFDIAEQLLDLEADPKLGDSNGVTPLHLAVKKGRQRLITKCLENGALVDAETKPNPGTHEYEPTHAESPLWWTARSSSPTPVEIFHLLRSWGAQKTVRGDDLSSMIHEAARNGHIELVQFLFEGGYASIDERSANGSTPLLEACMRSDPKMALMLIDRGADVSTSNEDDIFPLLSATWNDLFEVVNALLEAGADSTQKKDQTSALHAAAYYNNSRIANRLIESREDGDIDKVEPPMGETPLIVALGQDSSAVAQLLLQKDADAVHSSYDGWLPIHFACCYSKNEALLELLLSKVPKGHISAFSDSGWTPLMLASRYAFNYGVRRLLELGTDVNASNHNLYTALMLAVLSGSEETVKIILEHPECAPDKRNKDGSTALHLACEYGHGYAFVDKLMKRTIWKSRNRSEITPLNLAVMTRNRPAIEALLKNGMPVNFTSDSGSTSFHKVWKANSDILTLLFQHGSPKNVPDSSNYAPFALSLQSRDSRIFDPLKPSTIEELRRRERHTLSTAVFDAAQYDSNTLKWMLDSGLKADGRASLGENALHAAASSANPEALEVLLDQAYMKSLVDSKDHVVQNTPLSLAVQARSPGCVRILLQKGPASIIRKNVYGRSVFDYALAHEETLQILKDFNQQQYHTWREEAARYESREKELRHRIRYFIPWLQSLPEDRRPWGVERSQGWHILAEFLLFLGEEEHSMTAREQAYDCVGRHWLGELYCAICRKFKDTIGFNCSQCPQILLCNACGRDETRLRAFGCFTHKLLEYPRDSLFDRDPEFVNDKGQTEEEWMAELAEKFCVPEFAQSQSRGAVGGLSRAQINTRCAAELGITWLYPQKRSDVFEFCRLNDWDGLKAHLLWFPRDVDLRGSNGDNMTMWVLRNATDDSQALEVLRMLSIEAVRMLICNSEGETSITVACKRDFANCLAFLLSHYDPDFNQVEDKNSSDSIRLMIENGWDQALHFAVERHFDWASRGDFWYLEELDLLGLDDQTIVAMMKDQYFDVRGSLQEQTTTLLSDFEQPLLTGSMPEPNKHASHCIHHQCRLDKISDLLEVDRTPSEQSPDISPELSPVGDDESIEHHRLLVDDEATQSRSSISESISTLDKAAYFCGVAGIFPQSEGSLKLENQDGVLRAYVSFRSDDIAKSIGLLLNAGRGLLGAMHATQNAESCCDAFTVLCDVNNNDASRRQPNIRLCRIPFDLVLVFVRDVEKQTSLQAENPVPSILSSAGHSALSDICAICSFSRPVLRLDREEQVDLCCRMMQFLSLGFLSFLGAHSANLQLPTLRSFLPTVFMMGSKTQNAIVLRSRKLACIGQMLQRDVLAFIEVSMASVHLVDEPLQECAVLATVEDLLEIWGPGHCLFRETAEVHSSEMFAVALRRGFLALADHSVNFPRRAHWYSALDNEDWSLPGANESFYSGQKLLSGTLQSSDDLLSFHSRELLLIAGLKRNKVCQIGKFEQQNHESFQLAETEQKIKVIGTSGWRYALRTAQVSLGLQQYGAISGALGFDRLSGHNRKNVLIEKWTKSQSKMSDQGESWSDSDFKILSQPFGLVFSICSHFGKRVPLREALSEGWLVFTKQRPKVWDDWSELRSVIRARLKGENPRDRNRETDFDPDAEFRLCIRKLSHRKQKAIHLVILDMLEAFVNTGVDADGKKFSIAWPQLDDPDAGYQFECTQASAGWVRLLQDTENIATFAVVTSDCLVEVGREYVRCKNDGENAVSLTPLHLLDTRIVPERGASENWPYPERTCYLVAGGPRTGRAISLTTRIACRIECNPRHGAELSVLPAGVAYGFIFRSLRLSEGVCEAYRRSHPTRDCSKAVLVASDRDWRTR